MKHSIRNYHHNVAPERQAVFSTIKIAAKYKFIRVHKNSPIIRKGPFAREISKTVFQSQSSHLLKFCSHVKRWGGILTITLAHKAHLLFLFSNGNFTLVKIFAILCRFFILFKGIKRKTLNYVIFAIFQFRDNRSTGADCKNKVIKRRKSHFGNYLVCKIFFVEITDQECPYASAIRALKNYVWFNISNIFS